MRGQPTEAHVCAWRSCAGRASQLALIILFVFLPAMPGTTGNGQDVPHGEYEWKANFLARSISFVEWPPDGLPADSHTFTICVFGDFSFGTSLAEFTRGMQVHGKKVEVHWVHKELELKSCQVLFVSHSEMKRYAKVLEQVRGASIFTVGETQGFLEAGGVVALEMKNASLEFEVNLEAATSARLKVSSQLLSLAKRVINKAESAKS